MSDSRHVSCHDMLERGHVRSSRGMRPRRVGSGRPVVGILLILGLAVSGVNAGDWPWWRGPDRNGVVQETSGWPEGWPPQRLWVRDVGIGCTSPIIVGGNLYVMGWSQNAGGRPRGNPTGTDAVLCFDASTGRVLWRQSYACRYQGRLCIGDTGAYGGPSSTPSFDRETGWLYTLSVDGDLQCWDTKANGRRLWGINFHDTYTLDQRPDVGGGRRDYGFVGSPLLCGQHVVVEVGAREGLLMGFDKETGTRQWVSAVRAPAGHCGGPVPLIVEGIPCLATLALRGLVVVRTDGGHVGESVGTYPWTTEFACNIATPAVVANRVLVTSGYNHKKLALLDIGLHRINKVWESSRHALVGTPVVFEEQVYTVAGSLNCTAQSNGADLWRGGSFEHGSCLVTANDRKLIAFGNGTLALLEATPRERAYTELSRVDGVVSGTCYPHVTLSDGILACKDRDGRLVCYSVLPRPESEVVAVETDVDEVSGDERPILAWSGGRGQDDRARFLTRGLAVIRGDGSMQLSGGAVEVDGLDDILLARCRRSGQLTIEVIAVPNNVQQNGPARVVSFSSDPYHRNFTLGQERDRYVLRLRTPETGENGTNPETVLCEAKAGVTAHIIVTYSSGRLVCYLNGKQVLATDRVRGDFSNWSPQQLVLGDEWSGGRDWAGTLRRVTIESQAIHPSTAMRRYESVKQ